MISEASCDTEVCSNEKPTDSKVINYILKSIQFK